MRTHMGTHHTSPMLQILLPAESLHDGRGWAEPSLTTALTPTPSGLLSALKVQASGLPNSDK